MIANASGPGEPLVEISRTTVTKNVAERDDKNVGAAGGIYAGNNVKPRLEHVIVAGNAVHTGVRNDVSAGTSNSGFILTFSLIGDAAGTSLTEAPVGSPDANGNLIGGPGPVNGVIDPKLGPLAYNGGPVFLDGSRMLTHALLAGSPAINAGDPTAVAGTGGVPEFDQRGRRFAGRQ